MPRRTALLVPALLFLSLVVRAADDPAMQTHWKEVRRVVSAASALIDDGPPSLARFAARAAKECLRLAEAASAEDAAIWFDRAGRLQKRLEKTAKRAARIGEDGYAAGLAAEGLDLYLDTRRLLLLRCAAIRERPDFLEREDLIAAVARAEQAVDKAKSLRERNRPLSRALKALRKGYRKSVLRR